MSLKIFDMRVFILLLLFLPLFASAQNADIPRDTTYTVRSAYEKYVKQYPFIKIAGSGLPEGVVAKKNVVYRTLGERALKADVFYPAKRSKNGYPGVLLIHGGGWRSGDKSLLIPIAQQLAANGYVAVTAEYRLSLEAPYPAAVHDLKAAVRWMRANAGELKLDTSRIAALGTSAGGQLAALLGTTSGMKKLEGEGDYPEYSSNIQAIVDIDGVLAFKHPESEEGTVAAQWLGGYYEEATENWLEASALTHTGPNTPPVLFISSSFPRFHAGKQDMIKIMDEYGIYSETHNFPDSPHSFWLFHPWFEPTVNYTVSFLDQVLKQPQKGKAKGKKTP